MEREEGHPSYSSQSVNPAKGPTVGGRTDDPRREHTRDAPARHAARARTGQRSGRLRGGRDLADVVLPLASAFRALRPRRAASPPPAGAARPPAADRPPHRTAGARAGPGLADLGVWPAEQSLGPGDARGAGAKFGAADSPARGAGPAPRPPRAPGAAQRGHLRAADRADPPATRPRPESGASRPGRAARRAGVDRHVLHRQAEGGRQSLADHRLRRRLLVRGGLVAAGVHGRGRRDLPARRTGADLSAGGLDPAAGTYRSRLRAQGGLRRCLRSPRHSAHAHAAAPCVDQRLRGAPAGHDPARTLAHSVSPAYFTTAPAMQRSLEAFMKFYNEQRPHQGYRLRGRTPADLFWGAATV